MLRNLLVNWQIPIQIGEAKSIIYPYPYAQSCKTVLERSIHFSDIPDRVLANHPYHHHHSSESCASALHVSWGNSTEKWDEIKLYRPVSPRPLHAWRCLMVCYACEDVGYALVCGFCSFKRVNIPKSRKKRGQLRGTGVN
jgi:hypothetical protein